MSNDDPRSWRVSLVTFRQLELWKGQSWMFKLFPCFPVVHDLPLPDCYNSVKEEEIEWQKISRTNFCSEGWSSLGSLVRKRKLRKKSDVLASLLLQISLTPTVKTQSEGGGQRTAKQYDNLFGQETGSQKVVGCLNSPDVPDPPQLDCSDPVKLKRTWDSKAAGHPFGQETDAQKILGCFSSLAVPN